MRKGTEKKAHYALVGKPKGKIYFENLCKNGRKIQNGSYRHAMCGLNPSGSRHGPMADSGEQDNKPLASIKCRQALTYTSNYKLPKWL
jgi:hypothetical protein